VNTVLPDLSVNISRRRGRCVLDPNLALSQNGALLTKLLASRAEAWIVPELFAILDSASLYQREPELLLWPATNEAAAAEVPEILRNWLQVREEAGRYLCWVGDALRESCLPDDVDDSVLPRWEAAARSLDLRLPKTIEATGPLIAAMRDAAALCAILPASYILARATDAGPPPICHHLQKWGLSCAKLTSDDRLVAIERHEFLQLLIQAGLAPLVWSGLRLAIIHLSVPNVIRFAAAAGLGLEDEPAAVSDDIGPVPARNPWEDAKCFWYDVTEPAG
jgi:hypothetical protein